MDKLKYYSCRCGARRRADRHRGVIAIFSYFYIDCIMQAVITVRVMRHLGDSRYSNLWDGVISNA